MRFPFAIGAAALPLACGCAAKRPAEIRSEPPPAAVVHPLSGPPGELTLTRIGHATVLLQSGDQAVLADPWFTTTRKQSQGEPLAFGVDRLPRLTAVLASHGHYDHYDAAALAAYPDKAVPFLVRAGTGDTAIEAGFTDVRELDHWEAALVGGVRITATPAKHGAPENTYVIEMNGFTVFFGADSLKIPEFEQIHQRFPDVDLALLAVNGLTLVHEGQVVSGPEDAAQTAGLLAAKVAVPIHYRYHGNWLRETFLFDHPGTPEQFVAAARRDAPGAATFILETGQPLVLDRAPAAAASP